MTGHTFIFTLTALCILGFVAVTPHASAAYPVVEATNSGGNTAAAVSTAISLPDNVANGDLLMVFFVKDGTTAPTSVTGTGWSSLGPGAGTAQYYIAYWKIADGTDTLTVNHASVKTAYVSYRITGHNPSSVPEVDTATGSTANPNPSAHNPVSWGTEQTLWITSFAWDADGGRGANGTISAYSSNYYDSQASENTAGIAGDVGIAAASRSAYISSEDPGTATLSASSAWIARTFSVRPIATSSVTYSGTLYTDTGSTTAGAGEQVTVVVPDGESYTKLTNPGTLPAGNGIDVAYSKDDVYMAVSHVTTPFVTIYKRSGDTFTKLTNPSSLPAGQGNEATFTDDGSYLAVAHATSPFVTIYKRSGDTFTKLANPTDLPTGIGIGADFSPDGTYLAVAHDTSRYVTIYKRDGDTFTKLPDPSTLPPGISDSAEFSQDGNYLVIGHEVSPYITIYKRDGDTFTKLANPTDLPTGEGYNVSFSPNGDYLGMSHLTTPYITIYKRSGDTFTKLADPASLPPSTSRGIGFSPDATYLAVAHEVSPYVTIYKRSGDIFTRLPNPPTLPTGIGRSAVFSSDGTYLSISHDTSPYVTIYKFGLQNQTATDTTDSSGDWSVSITLSTTSPSTLVPAMAFVSSGTTTATTIFTDVLSSSVRTSVPLYGDTVLVHGTTSTSTMNRYYYYDSTDNARVLYSATSSELIVNGGFINASNTTMQIPPGYTLSVNGDVEQRGSLSATNSTWNFYGTAGQNISGNFTGANSFTTAAFENPGYKKVLSNASTTDILVDLATLPGLEKLTDSSTLPVGIGYGTTFSPDGRYFVVMHVTSPYISIYKRSEDTLTKLPDPATLPTGLGYESTFSPDGVYLSVTHDTSPYVTIYKRSGDTFTKLSNPATLPTGNARSSSFSSDGTYLSVAHATTPFVTIYKRTGDTFAKLTNPASLPASTARGTAFSPDDTYLSVAHNTTPYITIYKRSGDTFTKLTNPASLPPAIAYDTAFSPDGNYLSVVHDTSPYVTIYKRSGDTFTKLDDPVTLPTGIGYGTSFSPDDAYLTVAHATSPYVTIYKRSGDTFTKVTNPSTLPTGEGRGTAFSSDGKYLSVSHATSPFVTVYKLKYQPFVKIDAPTEPSSTSNGADYSPDGVYMALPFSAAPYINIYKRAGDTYTKLTDPVTTPTGIANGASFSPDATYLAVAHNTTPYVTIYKRSGDTFTKLSDPATLPAGNANAVDFSSDGTYLSVAHWSSPYITIYKRSGDTFTKLSDPATLPSSSATYGTAFSEDATYLAVAGDVTPFITIYKRSGDTFTKLSNPSSLPPDDAWAVSFSPDTSYVAVTHSTSPYLTIYKRSGDTFTKLTDPTDLPVDTSDGLAFSIDGSYLVINHTSSPYITIYKRDGDSFTKIPDPVSLPAGRSYGTAFSPDGEHVTIAHTSFPRISIYKIQALEALFTSPLTVAGSIENNGIFLASSTAHLSGSASVISGTPVSTTFNNLLVTGETTAETDVYIGDLNVDGTLSLDGQGLYITGDAVVDSNVIGLTETAFLSLSGDGAQNMSGAIVSPYLNLLIDGTATKTISSTLSVRDIRVADDTSGTSPVTFSGATLTLAGDFKNARDIVRLTDLTMSLAGDFLNTATLQATTSEIVFAGTATQIASSTAPSTTYFGDISITNTSGYGSSSQSVVFEFPLTASGRFMMGASTSAELPSNATTTVANLNLNGEAAASPVWLRASTLASAAKIDVSDLPEVAAYVNMRDMNNVTGTNITCYFCTNVANNTNWTFSQSAPATIDLELSNHTQGQVPNLFSTTNVTTGTIYAFKLAATGENVEIGGFVLPVSGIKNVDANKLINIKLWRDNNSNRLYDAGDSFIDSSTLVVNGKNGTITFDSTFTQSGTSNYIITGDTVGLTMGTYVSFKLRAQNIAGGGIVTNSVLVTTGTASNAQHIISGSGSGGGRVSQIGSAPATTTPVTGGGQGDAGGGAGEAADGDNFGDVFAYNAPGATGDVNNEWTNPSNALISDGTRATAASANLKQSFSNFSFAVPGTNVIRGIGVRLDASGSTAAGTLEVSLSWNAGANTTSVIATPVLSGTDIIYTVGGGSSLWGRSWTPAEFSNANFRVVVTSQNNNNTVRLDGIEVRIYSDATGGGGGGGGAI